MKAYYIIFRLLLITVFIACGALIIEGTYPDEANIAMIFVMLGMILIYCLVHQEHKNYKKLCKVVRELN